jgi:hypothetical protein
MGNPYRLDAYRQEYFSSRNLENLSRNPPYTNPYRY